MTAYRPNYNSPVNGVNGFWGSLGSGISSFANSTLGQTLLTVGTTLGTAALTQELFGKPQQQVQSAQPTETQYIPNQNQSQYTNPYFAPSNPATGASVYPSLAPNTQVPTQATISTTPKWLIPAAVIAVAIIIYKTRK